MCGNERPGLPIKMRVLTFDRRNSCITRKKGSFSCVRVCGMPTRQIQRALDVRDKRTARALVGSCGCGDNLRVSHPLTQQSPTTYHDQVSAIASPAFFPQTNQSPAGTSAPHSVQLSRAPNEDDAIQGEFTIDPCIRIPSSTLALLGEGETAYDRKNLCLTPAGVPFPFPEHARDWSTQTSVYGHCALL